jgi:hypothetical protein
MMAPRFKGKPNFDLSQPCPLCGYEIQPNELMRYKRLLRLRYTFPFKSNTPTRSARSFFHIFLSPPAPD